jgi:hypothetical protein
MGFVCGPWCQVLDRETGQSVTVTLPCGSTRESRCPSCANRARWLRMQQCRDGWHLADEPKPETDDQDGAPDDPGDDQDPDADAGTPGSGRPRVSVGSARPVASRGSTTCRRCRWRRAPSAVAMKTQ